MVTMLHGHLLNPELSELFLYAAIYLPIFEEYPIVVVSRSDTLYDIVYTACRSTSISHEVNFLKIKPETKKKYYFIPT